MSIKTKTLDFILILCVCLSVFSSDLYLSALPKLMVTFESRSEQIQLTLSLYFVGFALSMLLCAPLAKKLGNKKLILIGFSLYIMASLLCFFSQNLTIFIIGRILQSFGGCCGSIVSRVIAKQTYSKPHRLSNLLSAMFLGMGLTTIIAPPLGSLFISYFDWRANFLFLALFCLLLFVLICLCIQNHTPEISSTQSNIKEYFNIACDYNFRVYTSIITLGWASFFTYLSSTSFICINFFSLTTTNFSLFHSLAMIGFVLGSLLGRFFNKKTSPQILIHYSLIITLIGSSLLFIFSMSYAPNIFLFILPMFILLFGIGLMLSFCQILAIQNIKQSINHAFSLMYFSKMIFGAFMGWVGVYLMKFNCLPMATVIILCSYIAFFINYFYVIKDNKISLVK
ncbi:MAG: MFS transporter [Rhabdochlamydiaceae bacterium]|nr:MFS transporter [Candidatus Amphrikana amoebophyrae]